MIAQPSPKRISVFGATGSIGKNTLRLISEAPQLYQIGALTAHDNVKALVELSLKHRAEMAVIANSALYGELKDGLAGSGVRVLAGQEGLDEAALHPVDWVVSAIIGVAGLAPGLRALEQGLILALANKESLVTAGALFMETAQKYKSTVIPIDSEHSGLFQLLQGQDAKAVEKIFITASGGPFKDYAAEKLEDVKLEDALNHPIWNMGQRITIDSASMFNKALEMIEAHEFFGFSSEKIEVLIHPQAIMHALISFKDSGIFAHLSPSDMRHAIGYALEWPKRPCLGLQQIDLAKIHQLSFEKPDLVRFPALRLARDVMRIGGLSGAVFNGAKERVLDAFIAREIKFTEMAHLTEIVLERFSSIQGFAYKDISLEAVLEADHLARKYVDDARRQKKRKIYA